MIAPDVVKQDLKDLLSPELAKKLNLTNIEEEKKYSQQEEEKSQGNVSNLNN
jgi:hypothetical protein